jgi:hypothetical protein
MKLATRRAPILQKKLGLNLTLPNFVVSKRVFKDRKLTESCPRERRTRTDTVGCRAGRHGPAYSLVLGPHGPSSAGLCVSCILAYVVKRSQ